MCQSMFRSFWTVALSGLLVLLSWSSLPTLAIAMPIPAQSVAVVSAGILSFPGTRPQSLGVQEGMLTPCPTTPNCVNSQSQDATHRIAPLAYEGDSEAAFAQLRAVLQTSPRTAIITETDDYIYAEFTSALLGFVDDVEFYLNRDAGKIEVRSASRLGESDLGVNRDRIETIRASLDRVNFAA